MFLQGVFFDVEQPVCAGASVDAGLCAAELVAAGGGGSGGGGRGSSWCRRLRSLVGHVHLLRAHLVRARRLLLLNNVVRSEAATAVFQNGKKNLRVRKIRKQGLFSSDSM